MSDGKKTEREIYCCGILTEAWGTMRKERAERKKQTMKMSERGMFAVSSTDSCISLSSSSTRPLGDSDAITHLNAVTWCPVSWLSSLPWEGWETSDSLCEGPGLSQISLSLTHTGFDTKPTDGFHYLHARVPVTDGTPIKVLSGWVWQSCCIYTDVRPPYLLGFWIEDLRGADWCVWPDLSLK